MKCNKINSDNTTCTVLKNGDIRYTYKDKSGYYYDKTTNGGIKFYIKDGILSCEKKQDGTDIVYNENGNLVSSVSPTGLLRIYNPDGSVKAEFQHKKNKLNIFG